MLLLLLHCLHSSPTRLHIYAHNCTIAVDHAHFVLFINTTSRQHGYMLLHLSSWYWRCPPWHSNLPQSKTLLYFQENVKSHHYKAQTLGHSLNHIFQKWVLSNQDSQSFKICLASVVQKISSPLTRLASINKALPIPWNILGVTQLF